MKRITLTLLACLLTFTAAWAALPPLSQEERVKRSDDIVTGQVTKVEIKNIKVGKGSDDIYRLTFKVSSADKGDLKAGDTITVQYRKTKSRPSGWAGPQGQNEIVPEGKDVKLYLQKWEAIYTLLQPNGWDLLPVPSTTK